MEIWRQNDDRFLVQAMDNRCASADADATAVQAQFEPPAQRFLRLHKRRGLDRTPEKSGYLMVLLTGEDR